VRHEVTWVETAKGVGDIVQAVAILVGGIWAYFKFVRGRTFAYRGQLSIEGKWVQRGSFSAVHAHVIFENTGASQIPLSDKVKIVRAYATTAANWEGGHGVDWKEPLLTSPVFTEHAWVEPKEPIEDDVLLPIPRHIDSTSVFAYRVESVVGSKRRRGKAMKWTAHGLVLAVDIENESSPSVRTYRAAWRDVVVGRWLARTDARRGQPTDH
jgi:hypothetical protein